MIHVAMMLLLTGIAGTVMACVMGYSSILGFATGPLAYFSVRKN